MDFWNWLWVMAFPALLLGAWFTITNMGKRALSRHLSEPKEPVDPWDNWKNLASEARKRKATELAEWQREFQDILQMTCTHDFQADSLGRNKWWQCVLCGYEKPWEHEVGCSCVFQEDRSLTDPEPRRIVTHRNGNCMIHGRPRLIEYHKKNALEGRPSKGGAYLGLHNDRYIR